MPAKFYAVKAGVTPGIYSTWDECKAMVNGYPGAIYKSFKTKSEAQSYLGIEEICEEKNCAPSDMEDTEPYSDESSIYNVIDTPYAFVDGSFNISTNVYGFGGFVIAHGKKYILSGFGEDVEMASMRNVAGEVLGSMAAIKKAIELKLSEITIFYDYLGIEMWATGSWKRNKRGTIAYYDFIQSVKDDISIKFVKVKGHSGVEGNEEADRLAKQAVGI